MVSPAADVEVDEALVRALLEEQHPDLADLRLRELDAGWDNTLWRIGDELMARLPRRAVAAELTRYEQRWLPVLSPRLPLPVPVPVRIGQPSTIYPWAWSIVRWLAGTPADRCSIDAPEVVADQLGAFLRALHQPAPSSAPRSLYRGVPLVERADAFEERAVALASEVDVAKVRAVWERACNTTPWSRPPVWIHGDLHPANVLVADGALSAVIDFGDVCRGDPASDLAAVWMLLPPSSYPTFARAYGGIDTDLEARALGWAVLFGMMLLAIGLDDRPSYEAIGRRTLDHAILQSRAAQRDLVRRGYDAVSHAYRSDDGESNPNRSETTTTYAGWIDELVARLDVGARVLDIGCGAGIPTDVLLVEAGMDVTGVDISPVQIERARALVPGATFVCSDIVEYALEPSSFDAIVSLYALIHLPLDDQRELLPRIFAALRPAGLLLAIVGHERWTSVEDYLGAPMFWDHADAETYLAWLRDIGFELLWHRRIPEGDAAHTLVLAQRPESDRVQLRRAHRSDADAIADVWLRSRRASVPAIPPPIHTDDEIRAWFAETILPTHVVWVATVHGHPVALMVLDDGWIDQLYVDPAHMSCGIGSQLLVLAQAERPDGLDLWTFAANDGARRFYERHGFVAVATTAGDNEERAPDVRYHWRGQHVVEQGA